MLNMVLEVAKVVAVAVMGVDLDYYHLPSVFLASRPLARQYPIFPPIYLTFLQKAMYSAINGFAPAFL